MKYVCALITVSDMAVSRRFYETILHQEPEFDFGENVAYKGGFALHLRKHYEMLLSVEQPMTLRSGGDDHELYFETANFDEAASRIKDEGAALLHDVQVQPWGQRVMRFYDPDQHIVEIGETMETVVIRFYKQGFALDEISQRTSMPLAFVQDAVGKFEKAG